MSHAETFRRRATLRAPRAERETFAASQPTLTPETAVTTFQLMSGVGGGLASIVAANRLSGVEGGIQPGQLALPVGLSLAGTLLGAARLPGKFDLPTAGLATSAPRADGGGAATFRQRASIEHCEACENRRQRIMSHSSLFRARSSFTGRQGGSSPIRLKDNNLFLSEANVPDVSVAPQEEGGVVDVQTAVANGATAVEPDDLDRCDNDANDCFPQSSGEDAPYCYELEVVPEWTDRRTTTPSCLPGTAVGANEEVQQWTFDAPSTGQFSGNSAQFSVQFILTADGSGEFGAFSLPVTVEEGGAQRPGVGEKEVDADTDGNGNGGGNGGAVSRLENVLILVIVLAVLLQFGGE